MTKKDPNLLTQAEYARSRKARGLSGGSRQAVKKAVDEGRISAFGPDKLIDPDLADRQWDQNTRVRAAVNAPPPTPAGADAGGDLLAGDVSTAPAGDRKHEPEPATPGTLQQDPGYQEARSRQAQADARMAELKLAETEGQLVRIDQVRSELASKLAPVREALLQLPSRLAPEFAAQSDPARIQTALEVAIHQVLAPLAPLTAAKEGAPA